MVSITNQSRHPTMGYCWCKLNLDMVLPDSDLWCGHYTKLFQSIGMLRVVYRAYQFCRENMSVCINHTVVTDLPKTSSWSMSSTSCASSAPSGDALSQSEWEAASNFRLCCFAGEKTVGFGLYISPGMTRLAKILNPNLA